MRKKVLLSMVTAATISFTSLGALNTEAASNDSKYVSQYTNYKNFYSFIVNKGVNVSPLNKFSFVLGKFTVIPCPDQNKPNIEQSKPEVDKPVIEESKPEADKPVIEESKPEADKPVIEESKPEADKPVIEESKPEADKPVIEESKPEEEKPSTSTEVSAFEKEVVTLTNAERAKQGLKPLTLDEELSKVARIKSQDMKDKNYFDHNSPTYGSPFDMMKKFGITYKTAGENIAQGQRTPSEVVQAWMNSQGHRENIMNPNYTHIGIGHVVDNNYWTQMFIGK